MSDFTLIELLGVLRAGPAFAPPSRAKIPFDAMLEGRGWHSPETHGGVWFRWLGDEGEGEVIVNILRDQPVRLRLTVSNTVDHALVDEVVIRVDGTGIPIEVGNADGKRTISSVLPTHPSEKPRPTRITVAVPRTIQPPSETRRLSLAFSLLELDPLDGDDASSREDDRDLTLAGHLFPVLAGVVGAVAGEEAGRSVSESILRLQAMQVVAHEDSERGSCLLLDLMVDDFIGLQGSCRLELRAVLEQGGAPRGFECRFLDWDGTLRRVPDLGGRAGSEPHAFVFPVPPRRQSVDVSALHRTSSGPGVLLGSLLPVLGERISNALDRWSGPVDAALRWKLRLGAFPGAPRALRDDRDTGQRLAPRVEANA